MVAQANFNHKELQGLNGSQMQDKLMLEKNLNWNDLPVWQKRGICITKQYYLKNDVQRSKWAVDHETPIFSQNRTFINQYVFLSE
jgi:tRNA(His) 5'-end guanylyltransferase